MSRPIIPPGYLRHRGSDGKLRARVIINGRSRYLGGYGSPESRRKYERLLAEWRQSQEGGASPIDPTADCTVKHLYSKFMLHAQQHYRRADGSETTEFNSFRFVWRYLKLYDDLQVDEFSPLKLKAVRQSMIDAGLARKTINQYVGRIRRIFRWGTENELVPVTTYQGLMAVVGLARGRSAAKECEDVKPVSEADLAATLPNLNPVLRALAEFILLTGARSGEARRLRPCDLDRSDAKVWKYRPASHKTEHRGHTRTILIGPKAQAVLLPWLDRESERYCFSPRDVITLRNAERRAKRKTKVQPSQVSRAKPEAKKTPKDYYQDTSCSHAIRKACDRAGVPRWHLHQLRHNAATRLVDEFGWDVTRIVLGHRSLCATRIYAEDATKKAAEVMGKVG